MPGLDRDQELDAALAQEAQDAALRHRPVRDELAPDPPSTRNLAPDRGIVAAMRIVYGVVGEGMGHAMRSRVVLDHLVEHGHEVEIMASGRAVDYLKKKFPTVNEIHGLHIIYEENRVKRGKTLWSNVIGGAAGLPKNIAAYFELLDDFSPQVVLSDFESWTYMYGKLHRVPVISIDNMQIINRCSIPRAILEGHEADFQIAKSFVKSKLPFCDHYLITSFFRPEIRKPHTSLHPPILRPEILSAVPTRGDHLLVYQTAEGNDDLTDALAQSGFECRIYGMRRNITEEEREGPLSYRPFSEAQFIADLAGARGVVASGGFTLMGEAVYLHKPMLAIPLEAQFEQVLNARYLELEGFGAYAAKGDRAAIDRFVDQLEVFEANLGSYSQDGNRALLSAVDEHLDRAAAGVY
jgi:uncharacterized protein (TIGR00661 family)